MRDRHIVIGSGGLAMAAAVLTAGLAVMSPVLPESRPAKRVRRKQNRPAKQADSSKKQYLLKGIRP